MSSPPRSRNRGRDRDRERERDRRRNGGSSDDEGNSGEGSDDEGSADHSGDKEEGGDIPDDPEALRSKISELMEGLEAKRATTREESQTELKRLLATRFLLPYIDGKVETFLELLKRGIRKGSEVESKTAAENLSLFFLLLGPDNEALFSEFRSILQDLIRTHSSNAVKPAFVEALSIACFIASTELETSLAVFDFLEEVFSRNYSASVVAKAVDCWALLSTTIPPSRLEDSHPRILKQLKKLLEDEDYEVRKASGTTIALILEILKNEEIEVSFPDGAWDALLQCLKELANDSDRHKAKKERTKQRSIFRDILRSVEVGESPQEILKFKHEIIEVDSWIRIKQLDSLRQVLGVGLHTHFLLNDVVRQIFDLPAAQIASEEVVKKMSSIEKRMLYAPNAKARSKWLDSRRRTKTTQRAAESWD